MRLKKPLLIAASLFPVLAGVAALRSCQSRDTPPLTAKELAKALAARGYEMRQQFNEDGRCVAYYLRRDDKTPWSDFPDLSHRQLTARPGRLAVVPFVLLRELSASTDDSLANGRLYLPDAVVVGHPDELRKVMALLGR